MRTFCKAWIVRALALLLAASAASAQDRVPFRQEELDQMLAPVALYPDSLLSQMLMASTYPLEVVQAARWSRANPGLSGQDAVRAVEPMDWDPSVKSLTAFPHILSMMDENLEWTERLGEAFLVQQADVMDTIQGLRRRAEVAGNLGSDERMRVARQGEVITIGPPAPGVVFVPYYNPLGVYGPWWWPQFPPVFWAPPPHYVVAAHRPAIAWGNGVMISAGFFFGHFDWPHRHVKVVHIHHPRVNTHPIRVHAAWRHDPVHRRGVPFRHAARPWFEPARSGGESPRREAAPAERRYHDRPMDSRPRRPEERREAPRERREPAGRRIDTRPVVAPPARSDPRPAATAPAIRVEPRQAVQRHPRAEARADRRPAHAAAPHQRPVVRETPAASRAAVGAPRPALRAESNRQRASQAHGNSERRHPAGRGGDRKS